MEERWDELGAWERARQHDARAFASIFDHHEGRVFRHSLHLTESRHDAEDVTAGSFFELWRRREAVRLVGGSTLPWLLVTATNLSRNNRRALRRYRSVLDRLPRADSETGALFEPSFEVDRDLYSAMRRLNSVDGSLLILTAIEGLSVKDAAGVVGISDGAGRVRLHRAKERLRDQLQQHGEHIPALTGGNK